jgi:RNA polymerase sigma-70 factor (ECF subfamily)
MATLAISSLSSVENEIFFNPGFEKVFPKEPMRPVEHARRQEFEEVCRTHTKKIFQVIYRITKNREDAEDALQDSLLQAFLHLDKFDGRSAFSTWLTRIGINSALMLLRKRRGARATSLDGGEDSAGAEAFLQIPDRAADPERRYLEVERETTVREAIETLRPPLRRVVELQELGERSLKETAKMMSISVPAAKGRLFHAKKALRKSPKLKLFRRQRSGSIRSISPIRDSRLASQTYQGRALVA